MEETLEQLNGRYADALLPVTILFGVFMVCGVVGNVLVLIVFSLGRVYRENNIRVFVIFLAVIDLICCVLILPTEIAKHRTYFNITSVGLCRAKVFINMWGAVSCALALLVVSVDRYRRYCCPLKRQIPQRLALQLCGVITFGISVIVAIPGIVIHDIVTTDKTNIFGTKTVVYVCSIAMEFRGHSLEMIFHVISGLVLTGVSVSTIALYIPICKQIYIVLYSSPAYVTRITGSESQPDNHEPNQNETPQIEHPNATETAIPETDMQNLSTANYLKSEQQNASEIALHDTDIQFLTTPNCLKSEQPNASETALPATDIPFLAPTKCLKSVQPSALETALPETDIPFLATANCLKSEQPTASETAKPETDIPFLTTANCLKSKQSNAIETAKPETDIQLLATAKCLKGEQTNASETALPETDIPFLATANCLKSEQPNASATAISETGIPCLATPNCLKSKQPNASETALPETDVPFLTTANTLDNGKIQLKQHLQLCPIVEDAARASKNNRPPRTHTLDRLMTMTSFIPSFRRRQSGQRSRSRNLSQHVTQKFPYKTLIWLILTLVFIITNTLSMLLLILNPNIIHKDSQQFTVFTVFTRLLYINNCINPFVYALLCINFRKAIKGIGPRVKAKCCT